jgi:hypothetical protein
MLRSAGKRLACLHLNIAFVVIQEQAWRFVLLDKFSTVQHVELKSNCIATSTSSLYKSERHYKSRYGS